MEIKTRIYKYALSPTHLQLQQLEEAGIKSRILWNALVRHTFDAYDECVNGRRASIINEYVELMSNKKLVGMRSKAVSDLMAKDKITQEEALEKVIGEKVKKDTIIALRKDGTRYIRFSNKHLSRLYAAEKVNAIKDNILRDGSASIWYGILSKWTNFCESWEKGIFDKPRFKKRGQISAIQKQIGSTTKFDFGKYVNLSWCGSLCLENVEVINHRDLPQPSTIKQVAVVKNSIGKWFICIFLQAPLEVFARKFTNTGKSVGIDPGMKSALTTSDGEIIQPTGISRHNKKERKLKRLQRKLDRQTRLNNPQCFNENGTWKRGKRLSVRSKGMLETVLGIADIKRYYKDAKADYYHNAAIKLLNQYDIIGVGNAKIHTLIRGNGKAKHSQNSKIREHAISDFKAILKDKASLSLTSKGVYDINEAYTTQKCNVCESLTGPKDVEVRKWKCSKCNTEHDRDINAAINIKKNTLLEIANTAAAAQAVSDGKPSKVRRSTKVPKKQSPRSTETIKSQDDGLTQEALASGQVIAQSSIGSRSLYLTVTEQDTKVDSSVDSASPPEKMGHSQSQPCPTDTELVT